MALKELLRAQLDSVRSDLVETYPTLLTSYSLGRLPRGCARCKVSLLR